MPDIYLYPGEANPNDVKLRDPTVLAGGGGGQTVTIDAILGPASVLDPQVNLQAGAFDVLGGASIPAPQVNQQAGAFALLGGATNPAPQVNQSVAPGVLGTATVPAPQVNQSVVVPLQSAGTYQHAGLTYNGGIPYDGGAALPGPTVNQQVAIGVLGGATIAAPVVSVAAAGQSVLPDALGGASTPAPTVSLGISSPGALGGATLPAPTIVAAQVIVTPMLSSGTYQAPLTYNGGIPYDGGAHLPGPSLAVGGLTIGPPLLGGADVPAPLVTVPAVPPPGAATVTGRGARLRDTRVLAVAQGIRPARLGGAYLNELIVTVHENEDWVIDEDLLVLV